MEEPSLSVIIRDWLVQERLEKFMVKFPDPNSTVCAGFEGELRFDHRPHGWEINGAIHNTYIKFEYGSDSEPLYVTDPEFFSKLKTHLLKRMQVHDNCFHYRAPHD